MFETIQLNLNPKQIKALVVGKSVNVKAADVGTGATVYLSKMKANRLKKKASLGKGSRLSLSNPELAHNKQQGGSIFGDILSTATDVAKAVAQTPAGAALAGLAGNKAKDILDMAQLVGSSYSPDNPILAGLFNAGLQAGNSLGQTGIDQLVKKATGKGVGKAIKKAAEIMSEAPGQNVKKGADVMVGNGWFNDVMDGINDVAKVGNTITSNPLVQTALMSALMGGKGITATAGIAKKKRGRPRKGISMGLGNPATFLEDLQKQAGKQMDYVMNYGKNGKGIYAPGMSPK